MSRKRNTTLRECQRCREVHNRKWREFSKKFLREFGPAPPVGNYGSPERKANIAYSNKRHNHPDYPGNFNQQWIIVRVNPSGSRRVECLGCGFEYTTNDKNDRNLQRLIQCPACGKGLMVYGDSCNAPKDAPSAVQHLADCGVLEQAENQEYFKCTCGEYGRPLYWAALNKHLLSIPDDEFLSHFADKHIMEALADV